MNRAEELRGIPSGLQLEARRLLELLLKLLEFWLDRFFDLSAGGAGRRRLQLILLGIAFAAIALGAHLIAVARLSPESSFEGTALGVLVPPAAIAGMRIALLLGISMSLALHFAGAFQAGVFGLKDPRIAWRFIRALATGRPTEVIHLRDGDVSDSERDSPILLIGGPGHVVADQESAALFEKPDGTPHVVGPNGKTTTLLEGFERLRHPVVSLRDQYIGNPSGEPLEVVGRSQDGLPVSVTDVRGLFSIRREEATEDRPESLQSPFRFRAEDIESLIYKQAVPVLTSGKFPSGQPGDWTASMHVLIRQSLRGFMTQHLLAEFLAGVGSHEAERAEFQADTILTRTLQISDAVPDAARPQSEPAPRFRGRTDLSRMFKKDGSEFSTQARQMGMELHWIGVGTWKLPDRTSELAVNEKHVEAWRLNRENARRADPRALEALTEAALVDHKLQLIRDVPISANQRNQAKYSDKAVVLECILRDFWEQMGEALDVRYRGGAETAEVESLEGAIEEVERLLRISQRGHTIGGGTRSRLRERSDWSSGADGPPAPESQQEAAKYQLLLGKLQGDFRVAEAMIANERRRHGELSREQLITRIVERFERHGR